jgi:hypothetical protein
MLKRICLARENTLGKVSLLQGTRRAENTPQLRLHPERAPLRVHGRSIPLLDPNQFDPQKLVATVAHGTRVAFVQPMIPDGNYLPNLGIMCLASILTKAGYDVRVFDENVHADVQQLLLDFSPALIGYTRVGSSCIIGYPGKTKRSIEESNNYFLRLKLDSFAVVTCVPFPGTTAWQVCQQNGWFTKRAENSDNYWFEVFRVTPLIETPHLTAKELSNAIFWVYVRFYFLNLKRSLLVARMLAKQKLGVFSQAAPLRWLRMLRSNTAVARVPAN